MNLPLDQSPVPDYTDPGSSGAVCLVVGAGNGIGRQTAHAFSQAGYAVVCADVVAERAQRVADEVGGTAVVVDVVQPGEVRRLADWLRAEAIEVTSVVDVVGIARFGPLAELDDQAWDDQFSIVLSHARHLVRDLGPDLVPGSCFTFVSSAVGLTGGQGFGAYAAAKAALISLVKTAAVELGPRGIRVNSVAPGVVLTPRMAELLGQSRLASFVANAPLGRLAEASDIARAAFFLGTPASGYVTGHTLLVDGGVQARFPYPPFTDATDPSALGHLAPAAVGSASR